MTPRLDRGLLFVVSAPSATGKTTVVERLVEVCPTLVRSRSYTSRAARAGEQDGVDYNFVSRPAFDGMVERGEFLEWADVFGNRYGTARRDTEALLSAGERRRARHRRAGRPAGPAAARAARSACSSCRRRSRRSSCGCGGAARTRTRPSSGGSATARTEVSAVDEYDYVVVNDDLERCVKELAAIVTAERARRARRRTAIEPIRADVQGSAVAKTSCRLKR